MHAFKLGFISTATAYGLSAEAADRMLKRAFEYPDTANLFKDISPQQENQDEEQEDSPEDIESLSELLKQELLHRHMDAAKHQIQL